LAVDGDQSLRQGTGSVSAREERLSTVAEKVDFASTGARARDASGDGKSNGPLSAGRVEWEADDVGCRTAVGRGEQGLRLLARPGAASAGHGGDRVLSGVSGKNGFRCNVCGGV
jgi:hypothetical protein